MQDKIRQGRQEATKLLTTRALGTVVLATGVTLLRRLVARAGMVVRVVGRDIGVGLGTSLEVLGRDVAVDEARVVAAGVGGGGLNVITIGANVFVASGDIKERVGGGMTICGRIVRYFTRGRARLALGGWHMECVEGVEIDVELRGKETMLRDGASVGRKRLVVERLKAVV